MAIAFRVFLLYLQFIKPINDLNFTSRFLFPMKKITLVALMLSITLLSLIFSSCARGISPYEAASGKAKCGRYIR